MSESTVTLIAAMTLCGRISPAPLASAIDRSFLENMRDDSDASIMGCSTLREGDPEMRGSSGIPDRLRALVTATGEVPVEGKKIFAHGPPPLLFCSQEREEALRRRLGERAEVIGLPRYGNNALSLAAAIAALRGRGARRILIEGGGTLNYHALQQRVVDEILLTITPQLSGARHVPSLADGPEHLGTPFLELRLLSCRAQVNGELFTHYQVVYEEDHG